MRSHEIWTYLNLSAHTQDDLIKYRDYLKVTCWLPSTGLQLKQSRINGGWAHNHTCVAPEVHIFGRLAAWPVALSHSSTSALHCHDPWDPSSLWMPISDNGKSCFGQFATIRNMQPKLTWLISDQQLSQGTESKGDTSLSLCLGYSHNLSVNLPNPDPAPKPSVSLACKLGSRNSQDAKSKPSRLRFCDCWRLHRHKSLSSIQFLKFLYIHDLDIWIIWYKWQDYKHRRYHMLPST